MARLNSSKRASLPDNAFAYVDSHGRRRLPIHDEAHVRNALAGRLHGRSAGGTLMWLFTDRLWKLFGRHEQPGTMSGPLRRS